MSKLAIHGGPPVRTEPYPPWPVYDEREIEALREVVESRCWTSAPYLYRGRPEAWKVRQLEERFAAYHDARYGIATGSGTDALQIAFAAAGVGPGDEVILSPVTFIASATPILHLGAVPVFADVDPETLNLDPAAVEAAITERTKAISPVHLGGYPCDMDRINEIAARHGLMVVADACHAHGSEWRGRKVGALSHLAAFSFQQEKQITCGEGGMTITNDPELYALCYMYHNDGRGMDEEGGLYKVQGWNFRMSAFQAAVLSVQLERLDALIEQKTEAVAYLEKEFAAIGGLRFPKRDPRVTRQSYLYPRLRYDRGAFGGVSAERFGEALQAEGIPASGRSGLLLYEHPLFVERRFISEAARRVDYTRVRCPVAEAAKGRWIHFDQRVLLGSREDLDDFVEAVAKVKANLDELRRSAG